MKVKITQSPDPVPVLCYEYGMSQQHHRRQFVREVASAGAAMVLMSQNQIPMSITSLELSCKSVASIAHGQR